tara:strand:+ start:196 stop:825 length:630 start_codon:yes stop_codon:yes gene_type:complete
MKRLLFLFLFFLSSCDNGSDLNIEEAGLLETAEIYLLNNLGHLPGFCLDVAEEWPDGRAPMQSAGAQNMNVDLDKPLQAHSCHSLRASNTLGATGYGGVSADQGFDISKIGGGEFNLPSFSVCMEVENPGQRSDLLLRDCDQNPNQKFVFEDDGKIKPVGSPDLCLTVSNNYFVYGGVYMSTYYVRDLFLSACNPLFAKRQSWGLRLDN